MKRVILAALVATALAAPAGAAEKLKFAVVPKAMNNPFFDFARDGCIKRAKELGTVECVYRGPIEHEPATEVQIIQDLITQRVDGLAISVSDVGASTGVIKAARDAGIHVITFDADAPGSAREAYIGTNNKDLGRALGEMLVKAQPHAGTYGMVSGGPAAANLNERLEGVREVVGKAGWKEVSGSPTYCNDDAALAVQQLNDLTTAHPDLNAVVAGRRLAALRAGGLPEFRRQQCRPLQERQAGGGLRRHATLRAAAPQSGLRRRPRGTASVRDGREGDGRLAGTPRGQAGARDHLYRRRSGDQR